MIVETRDFFPQFRRRLEKERPEQQQVVVVDEVSLLLAPGVVGIDPGEILQVIDELWVRVTNDVFDRDFGVDVSRVDVLKRLFFRKSL